MGENLTVTTQCCYEDLCNLFSPNEDFNVDMGNDIPMSLVHLESPLKKVSKGVKMLIQNGTIENEIWGFSNNSRDRLITITSAANKYENFSLFFIEYFLLFILKMIG